MTGWGPESGQGLSLTTALDIWGAIEFSTRDISTLSGDGTYSIPIWAPGGFGTTGAGMLPGGANVGLFLADGPVSWPLATARLQSDNPGEAAFFESLGAEPKYAYFPGGYFGIGSTPRLVFRVWQGHPETLWESATGLRGEVTFTSQPLGRGVPGVVTPALGFESGVGYILDPTFGLIEAPEPSTVSLFTAAIGLLVLTAKRRGFRKCPTPRKIPR
jgi:hypothetical protein